MSHSVPQRCRKRWRITSVWSLKIRRNNTQETTTKMAVVVKNNVFPLHHNIGDANANIENSRHCNITETIRIIVYGRALQSKTQTYSTCLSLYDASRPVSVWPRGQRGWYPPRLQCLCGCRSLQCSRPRTGCSWAYLRRPVVLETKPHGVSFLVSRLNGSVIVA